MDMYKMVLASCLFLVWNVAEANELRACLSTSPRVITSLNATHGEMLDLFKSKVSYALRAVGLQESVDIKVLPYGCMQNGRATETIAGKPVSRTTRYTIRVSIDLFEHDVTATEWAAVHAVCHIRQGTALRRYDHGSPDERHAERCVSEVLGPETHAAAYAMTRTLFKIDVHDVRDRYLLALRAIKERIREIPDPWHLSSSPDDQIANRGP